MMTFIAKKTASIVPALATALGLGGAALAADQVQVTMAVPNPSAITWAPMWVAVGEGYFKEEGFTLQVEAVDGSSQVLQAMSSGQAQLGAPGPGPLLAARSRGADPVFIYNLYPKSVFGLLAKADAGASTPEDLKGQTVGVGSADGAEVAFARAIFGAAGMQEGSDFDFLQVGDGGTAAVAFLRDEIVAYSGAISDMAILAARGIELTEITPEEYLASFGNGFAANQSYISENPEIIEGFGRALVKAMHFMRDPANRETVLAHNAAGNPQEGADADFAGALLDSAIVRMTPTDTYFPQGFGYQPPEHWERWQEDLVSGGALAAPLEDLAAAYSNDFVATWNAK